MGIQIAHIIRRALPFLAILLCVAPQNCGRVRSGAGYAPMERAVFTLVNRYRREQGLRELVWNDAIAEECRIHSRNMASGKVSPGHAGAEKRFINIRRRIPATAFAENVALNRGYHDPAGVTVEGWIGSPGHQHNLVGDYDRTGVGIAMRADSTFYFTQIYIRSR